MGRSEKLHKRKGGTGHGVFGCEIFLLPRVYRKNRDDSEVLSLVVTQGGWTSNPIIHGT